MDPNPTKRPDAVGLEPLEKDGAKLLSCVDGGDMAAILSGDELMYVLRLRGAYHCFIHKLDAPEGRHKAFAPNERNRAMLKNLDAAADELFRIFYEKDMDPMGVMAAAERGICHYLDKMGRLPVEDVDFMAAYEPAEQGGDES